MTLDDFIATAKAAATADSAALDIRNALNELVSNHETLAQTVPLHNDDIDEVLFEDDTLTVMLCETTPGVDQAPHDHQLQTMIGIIDGAEVHRFFQRTADGIVPAKGRTITAGDVLSMTPDAIHAIGAPGPEQCRAVHVYLGRIATVERSLFHPETLAEEPLTIERYAEFARPVTGAT